MFRIRLPQFRALEAAANEALVSRLAEDLHRKYASGLASVSPELFRTSVEGWVQDARLWGLSSPELVARYVESCVVTQRTRADIESRLKTYLVLYHEERLAGMDLESYVGEVVGLARAHGIGDEEAIAWLAVLGLAAPGRRLSDHSWVGEILGQPDLGEEARVRRVHEQALRRGWVAGERTA